MMTRAFSLTLVVVALAAPAARAEELSDLLRGGPVVRVETDSAGKLRQATCIADVDAPVDQVWKVLTDYDNYKFFMPRIDKLEVTPDGADTLLAFKLDTPLVSTSYTNRMHPDAAHHIVTVTQVKGDLDGSHYQWKLIPLGEGRTRIYYQGIVKNFASLAESFEDDQQTLSIGVNVVSLMAAAKAVKLRAEQLQRTAASSSAAAP